MKQQDQQPLEDFNCELCGLPVEGPHAVVVNSDTGKTTLRHLVKQCPRKVETGNAGRA